MRRSSVRPAFAGALSLLLIGVVGPPTTAIAKTSTPHKLTLHAQLSGSTVTVSWSPATKGTTVELRISTAAGGGSKPVRQTATASGTKKSKAIVLKGLAAAPQAAAVSITARACVKSHGHQRCSALTKAIHPTAGSGGSGSTGTGGTGGTGTSGNTAEGVPTVGGCQVLPATNAFNQDVSSLPVDPKSDAYLSSIGLSAHVHPDFGAADLGQGPGGFGIPYEVVPQNEPLVRTIFTDYADESDPGPYPAPLDAPIEGGPNSDGDRHVIVIRQGSCDLYEMDNAHPKGDHWEASGGARFDLKTGAPRPAGWTSADAAGLPIFPGLARYDEVAAGAINHALRFTVSRTQKAYIAPASHWASSDTDPNLPPMGLRLRMRADYDISKMHGQSLVVATALKRYGMIVADNGSPWYISGAPSTQWSDDDLNQLKAIPGSAFEVVKTGAVVTP